MAKKVVSNDEKISILLSKIEERKKELKSIESPKYVTNMIFSGEGYNNHNLNSLSFDGLVELTAFLLRRKEEVTKAEEFLGVKMRNPLIFGNNFTIDQWLEDVKTRIKYMDINLIKSKLKADEDKLTKLYSEEKKKSIDIDNIASDYGV